MIQLKISHPRNFLADLFQAAVSAADPLHTLARYLPAQPKGKTVVIGAGKGVTQLAKAFEQVWQYEYSGVVVTPYGYAASQCKKIEVLQAAHPVPDEAGLIASQRLLNAVTGLSQDDLVIALICGGGSALLPAPPVGCTLADEQALNQALLASGAPIEVMNKIRIQCSRIKGGRLARAAYPAQIVNLIVSDIPGDNPALVSSGPTLAASSSLSEAQDAIAHYKIALTDNLRSFLQGPIASSESPPMPNDACFSKQQTHVIASAHLSLQAAAERAKQQGISAHVLSDSIEGEAREVAKMHAAIARNIADKQQPFTAPTLLLSGGETTVRMLGSGKGGRNSEFMLSFLLHMAGIKGITALSADTDGIDGSEDNAGAYADSTSLTRLYQAGCDPMALLLNNDAWSAFQALGDLFVPGPTGTNVNDFRAILIDP